MLWRGQFCAQVVGQADAQLDVSIGHRAGVGVVQGGGDLSGSCDQGYDLLVSQAAGAGGLAQLSLGGEPLCLASVIQAATSSRSAPASIRAL